jgi:hypothetical protein
VRLVGPRREVPFFVPLRHFARHANGTDAMSRYLVDEILGKAKIRRS